MTRTPYAAPTLSRFITAALSGTSSERNTSISRTNDSRHDGRDEHRQPVLDAVTEVGEDGHLAADVGACRAARQGSGNTSERSRSIVSRVASSWGVVVGSATRTATSGCR